MTQYNIATDHDLGNRIDNIALEANVVSNLAEYTSSIFNDIYTFVSGSADLLDNLKNTFSELQVEVKDNGYNGVTLTKDQLNFLGIIKVKTGVYFDFAQEGTRLVSVPENFDGDFLTYVTALNSLQEGIFKTYYESHKDYTTILKGIITNRQDKVSLRDHEDLFKRLNKHREGTVESIKAFFPENSGKDKRMLRDVVKRANDFEPLFKETAILQSKIDFKKLDELKRNVSELTDLLSIIRKQLEEGDIKNISKQAARTIAEGAKSFGEYIRFMTVFFFDVLAIIKSIDYLVTDLLKRFSK